ncbi:MAG: hypothetical protein Q9160_003178 [Pyrenula sp. 1 TL-2023]
MADPEQQELITTFCSLTGAQPDEAHEYLVTNQWNLDTAATEFYTAQEEAQTGPSHPPQPPQPHAMAHSNSDSDEDSRPEGGGDYASSRQPFSGGGQGRRLGDEGDPLPATSQPSTQEQSKSSSKSKQPQKKFATLGDFSGGSQNHTSDDEDEDEKQDFFAGGEKSGLAVQNPDDIKKKILERARKGAARPGGDEPSPTHQSNFSGSARTLGGDDAPSRVIEPPSIPQIPRRPPQVTRVLHFWSDGFSVDDGELYRSDDPRNQALLEQIRGGSAPLSVLNVEPGQPVDVNLEQHDSNYVKPKKKYKPFEGQGNRLGSPTPGTAAEAPVVTSRPASTTTSSNTNASTVDLDQSQPTVSLQIRLADGTRLSSRFNTTHTVGDVYGFVTASSPQSRSWVLMTTFPSKELTDKSQVLGDLAEFKRGGVVIQKLT